MAIDDPARHDDDLDEPAGTPPAPARIRLLPAREAPYVVIVRRKPTRHFHIVRWNTETGEAEHGSWFEGRIYAGRSDVSFDGQWMVYMALGSNADSWTGVCRVPFLRTEMEGRVHGTWFGGGYFRDRRTLVLNGWKPEKGQVPFRVLTEDWSPEDLQATFRKLERDGFTRVGPDYGVSREDKSASSYTVIHEGDDGWRSQPSPRHPVLTTRYVGYARGYQFRFSLPGAPELIDSAVDAACWDSRGQLVFSRRGVVSCFALKDIPSGVPTRTLDLELLMPPPRGSNAAGEH